MDIEIEEESLSTAGEGALGAGEYKVLRLLSQDLVGHSFKVGSIEDIDIAYAECAGVVGLHGGEESIEVSCERTCVFGRVRSECRDCRVRGRIS